MAGSSAYALSRSDDAREYSIVDVNHLAPLFRQAIIEQAPWDEEEMEVTGVRIFPKKVKIPEGRLEIDISTLNTRNFLGKITGTIKIKIDGILQKRVRIAGRVEIFRPVVCVSCSLPKGHVLSEEDLQLTRHPLSKIRGRFFQTFDKVTGLELKRSVRTGQILHDKLLTPPIMVHRGDRVTIMAQSPCMTVSTPGEARQNGAYGAFIRVRNVTTQREVFAKVLNSNTVIVNF